MFLDARPIGEANIKTHFPNIYRVCKDNGIDIVNDMIPVVPAAHYSWCGVVVDEWEGRFKKIIRSGRNSLHRSTRS